MKDALHECEGTQDVSAVPNDDIEKEVVKDGALKEHESEQKKTDKGWMFFKRKKIPTNKQ